MLKKIIPWVVVGIFAAVFVVAFDLKDTMNSTISEKMKQQASPELTSSGEAFVNSLHNNSKNSSNQAKLFEYGSILNAHCNIIENVLKEII